MHHENDVVSCGYSTTPYSRGCVRAYTLSSLSLMTYIIVLILSFRSIASSSSSLLPSLPFHILIGSCLAATLFAVHYLAAGLQAVDSSIILAKSLLACLIASHYGTQMARLTRSSRLAKAVYALVAAVMTLCLAAYVASLLSAPLEASESCRNGLWIYLSGIEFVWAWLFVLFAFFFTSIISSSSSSSRTSPHTQPLISSPPHSFGLTGTDEGPGPNEFVSSPLSSSSTYFSPSRSRGSRPSSTLLSFSGSPSYSLTESGGRGRSRAGVKHDLRDLWTLTVVFAASATIGFANELYLSIRIRDEDDCKAHLYTHTWWVVLSVVIRALVVAPPILASAYVFGSALLSPSSHPTRDRKVLARLLPRAMSSTSSVSDMDSVSSHVGYRMPSGTDAMKHLLYS